jgi:hypothetical protein
LAETAPLPGGKDWCEIDVVEFAKINHLLFPGQLLNVAAARQVGGFRKFSKFCGDWEMWFKLTAGFGGAQTARAVSFTRSHAGAERGTNAIDRAGVKDILDHVQRKRNLAQLRQTGMPVTCRREELYQASPLPSSLLLRHGRGYSERILRYNVHLFCRSRAPHLGYALVQAGARLFGPRFIRLLSRAWAGVR